MEDNRVFFAVLCVVCEVHGVYKVIAYIVIVAEASDCGNQSEPGLRT